MDMKKNVLLNLFVAFMLSLTCSACNNDDAEDRNADIENKEDGDNTSGDKEGEDEGKGSPYKPFETNIMVKQIIEYATGQGQSKQKDYHNFKYDEKGRIIEYITHRDNTLMDDWLYFYRNDTIYHQSLAGSGNGEVIPYAELGDNGYVLYFLGLYGEHVSPWIYGYDDNGFLKQFDSVFLSYSKENRSAVALGKKDLWVRFYKYTQYLNNTSIDLNSIILEKTYTPRHGAQFDFVGKRSMYLIDSSADANGKLPRVYAYELDNKNRISKISCVTRSGNNIMYTNYYEIDYYD
jgi:hypothetical protein